MYLAVTDMTVDICVEAGIAVVPQKGVFPFRSVLTHTGLSYNKRDLASLPWDSLMCLEMEIHDDTRFNIRYKKIADHRWTFVSFSANSRQRLTTHDMVCRLQRYWRRVRAMARRKALAMGLHSRLGEYSPITEDIVASMVKLSLI